MDEKQEINKKLLGQLLLYLILGWFIFSVLGYWPRIISIPVPEVVQRYNSIFYLTGNSYINKFNVSVNEKNIKSKIFHEYGAFTDEGLNLQDGKLKYQSFYISLGNMIDTRPTIEIRQKNITSVHTEDIILQFGTYKMENPYEFEEGVEKIPDQVLKLQNGQMVYEYAKLKNNTGRVEITTINFKKIADILSKNEKEKISIKEMVAVLQLVKNKNLLDWYPEEELAVFCNRIGKNVYISTYKNGELNKTNYGPIEYTDDFHIYRKNKTSVRVKNGENEYIWDFVSNEKHNVSEEK